MKKKKDKRNNNINKLFHKCYRFALNTFKHVLQIKHENYILNKVALYIKLFFFHINETLHF